MILRMVGIPRDLDRSSDEGDHPQQIQGYEFSISVSIICNDRALTVRYSTGMAEATACRAQPYGSQDR